MPAADFRIAIPSPFPNQVSSKPSALGHARAPPQPPSKHVGLLESTPPPAAGTSWRLRTTIASFAPCRVDFPIHTRRPIHRIPSMALRRDAKIELLKKVPLFAGCSKAELRELARIA